MARLGGCCSSSTRGGDVIICPAPEGAGRTVSEQHGHYSHYNTKISNSRYFHENSCRIALTEPPSWPSRSWKCSEHCHPLCIWMTAIVQIILNCEMKGINWPAGFDACHSNCSIHLLVCVLFQMSCCEWLELGLGFYLRCAAYRI